MKRLVLMLMMLMMPLQFTWAAVNAYCQHETSAAAQHFGHHDHKHAQSAEKDDSTPGKVHSDCGYCHLAQTCAAVPAVSMPAFVCDGMAVGPQSEIPLSYFSDGPERPKWMRFA